MEQWITLSYRNKIIEFGSGEEDKDSLFLNLYPMTISEEAKQ